jgi:Mce-associated membrane protein
MTKPQSERADVGSNEREKESAAVRIGTETTTGHNDTTVDKTALIESETKELTSTEDSDDATDATSDDSETDTDTNDHERNPAKANRRISWSRLLAFGLLPGLALLMAVAAAYLRYQDGLASDSGTARIESVAAAKESTIALLSYKPETAEKELGAARDRLTGTFKESYTQLTHDVVIPGAKQKHISAVATVPAAASVSATPAHAVALVFINQTVVIGTDNPTDTTSSVRVTLDKVAGRWLISGFDPV